MKRFASRRPTKLDRALAMLKRDAAQEILLPAIPKGVRLGEVFQQFADAAIENPDILECDGRSIVRALARATSWDLRIGSTSFLIPQLVNPFERDVKPRLMAYLGYRGKLELLVRFRIVRPGVVVKCVYANETFVPRFGGNPDADHIAIADEVKRGPMIASYALAKITEYRNALAVVTIKESEARRKEFSERHRAGSIDTMTWYPKRCAVHELQKDLPIPESVMRMLVDDSDTTAAVSEAA